MKIGIDISQIVYGTGVSVYTKNLVRNLLEFDKDNEYILFAGTGRRRKDVEDFISSLKGNFSSKIVLFPPSVAEFVWNRLHIINVEYFTGKIDIFHSSDWTSPPSRARKVATIHDLSPLRYPKLTDPRIVSVHKAVLSWVKREADRIIVPSSATREDLILLKVDGRKIHVIPEAAEPFFKKVPFEHVKKTKQKYGIRGKYLLTIGVGERKNTDRIIEAYNLLKLDDTEMVFVGKNSGWASDVKKEKFLGFVSDTDLRSLYSGAQALVYPSIYEGFGLPILQAFSCQCPVVTSNLSSMPEVAGDAAITVDPFSTNSIAEGIESVIKKRQMLIERGLMRVKEFTWRKNAQATLALYNDLGLLK